MKIVKFFMIKFGHFLKSDINFISSHSFNFLNKKSIWIFGFFLILISCRSLIYTPPPFFAWPLKKYKLTQNFAPVWNPSHQGVDFKAPRGTPVLASHSGKVIYAGQRLTGYGLTVIVEFSPYWSTLYSHLHTITVKEGQKVLSGHQVGTVGRSGKASGDHLHFEIIYKTQPVNPLLYLQPLN